MKRVSLMRIGVGVVLLAGLTVLLQTPYAKHQRVNRMESVARYDAVPRPAADTPMDSLTLVAFDTETTGINPNYDRIVEIGAARYENGVLVDQRAWLVDPQQLIPEFATRIHGISAEDLVDAEPFEAVYPEFAAFAQGAQLIAHNGNFDVSFMRTEIERAGYPVPDTMVIDTLQFFRRMLPDLPNYRLGSVADHLDIQGGTYHRAEDDAIYAATIFLQLASRLGDDTTLASVYAQSGNLVPFQEIPDAE
jgi:DNA polymerase III subunit epsilon